MQRKQIVYLVAILTLLAAMLPVGAAAQGEAPVAPQAPFQIEVVQPQLDAPEGDKPAATTVLPDVMAAPDGMDFFSETEPNGTAATANSLPGNDTVAVGNIFPNGDLDYFSFTGAAGDRVYAATMTSFSASGSVDSYLTLFASDGTTVIEDDNDNGSFGSTSSSIAGATLPASGTYFLQVRHNSATSQLRPYRLHLKVQSGSPTPEIEPNSVLPGQPLPPSGWVSGALTATTDIDIFAVTLNAGDTIYMSLDLDPERDTFEWNAQLGLAVFNNFILVVNDAGATGPDSEAYFMTVKDAGTYYVHVLTPTGGTTFGTYHLSVSVVPKAQQANCTTYTSTDVPVIIPSGPGLVQSTLTVPGNPRIADIDVSIVLTHTFMQDLDVHLVSPAGNDNGLFTDVGNGTVGSSNIQMNTTLDDEAALPIGQFTVVAGPSFTPELNYRLSWYDYTDAGGVWTLKLYDDVTGDGGVLQSWGITICEPPPPPTCPVGFNPVTVYSSDFEADDGGFTHSGVQDEWERGLPTFTPLTTCNSGSNCWVTDLDNTYNASSNQNLLSPAIDLSGYSGPVIMRWAQRYHIESATFDGAYAQVQEVGGANPTRLWTWLDATMNNTVGNPSTTIAQSAGWGERWADISSYAGQNIEALFNLSSDTTVQLAGLAIDDVSVTACEPAPSNPAITLDKTVGTDVMSCATTDQITLPPGGGEVTYCYEVTNTGDVTLNLHDLDDSELGNILTGLSYALAPGASAFITETTTINVTTVNTATWTAYNAGPVDVVTASDVATVTVEAAANPAITLNKTVGTVPAVCAATNQISVPYGTSVYYCYQVQNTGNVTMTMHSLVDDQLGTLATNLPYVLPPGAFSPQIIVPDTAVIAVTNTATWTAASSVGYTVDTNAAFNYIPINTTGTGLGLTDDGEANITIPWAATFFGVTSSNLRVGNNGVILFNATAGDVGTANAALPNAALGLAIAPFWDDIDSDTGDVYWEVQGTAPNRMLIVEWYNRPHFSNIGSVTFQAILYETSNEIKYQYLDVDFGDPLYSFGASATVGINKDASTALQVSFNQPVIQNGQAILFTPAAILTASDSDWAEVNVLIPNIDVAPLSLSATQATNTTTNQPLNIGNTGDAPLTWEIAETAPDAAPRSGSQAAPEPVFAVPAAVTSKEDCAAFENYPGREPAGWAEFCGAAGATPTHSPLGPTSNGYSVDLRNDRVVRFALNNFPGQVLVGPQIANLYGLDFDSTATTLYALNDATTDQLGTVDTATGVFTPIVNCPAPAGGTWTGLSIDPVTNVFYASTAANLYTIDSATCSPTLIGPFGVTGGIMIDIAIGSAGVMYGHDIFTDSIYTIDTSTGAATLVGPTGFLANFAQGMDFDNEDGTLYIWLYIGTGANRYGTVNLATGAVTPLATDNPLGEFEGATETLGLCIPTDYGWLSLTPTAGTTAPAATTAVDVAFDSTGLAVGTYTGQLCVRSNDPDNGPGNETDLVIVPVTLTVQPPTAVALDGLAASSEPVQAPLPLAGLPLAALPAAVGLALGAAYVLRRKA